MKFVDIFSDYLVSRGFMVSLAVQTKKKWVTFSWPNTKNSYRIQLSDGQLQLRRVNLKSQSLKGQICWIPENKVLLSVDIHDPSGTKEICDYIDDLVARHKWSKLK
jgi:hypothetical protein